MLGAHTSQCWGSDKDMIFAPATLTLLVWWCYPPSLSTQTFRIKSDPKTATLSASRNPPFSKKLWKPSQEEERLSFCSGISKHSLAFPYLSPVRHGRDRRGEFTRYSFISLLAFSYKDPQSSFKKGPVPSPRGDRRLLGKF